MNGALKIVYHQANKKDAPELAMAISPEARPSSFSIRTPNRMICFGTYRDVLSIDILVATVGSVKRFWWWVSLGGKRKKAPFYGGFFWAAYTLHLKGPLKKEALY